jgi:hypothetical protein
VVDTTIIGDNKISRNHKFNNQSFGPRGGPYKTLLGETKATKGFLKWELMMQGWVIKGKMKRTQNI